MDALSEMAPEEINFVKNCISEEVEATSAIETLFRSNSIETKVITVFTRKEGQQYLVSTLQSVLTQIINMNRDMEIFENKIADKANLDTNRQNVAEAFQMVFDRIMESASQIPWQIKYIQSFMIENVKLKFPNLDRSHCAGSIFFLRFVCPSLVIPDKLNIVTATPSPNVQRGLLFITKMLQTLASDVLFGVKEVQMLWFNPIIEKNRARFKLFLDQITEEQVPAMITHKKMSESNYQKLRSEIITILDKLEPILVASDIYD